jgi:PLP dependent protein
MSDTAFGEAVAQVQERIAAALARAGRTETVTLLGVTKTVSAERIVAAYQAGLRDFGENYAQEFRAKVSDPTLELPELRWHFIGHLQTNKVKDIVGKAALIHSVDSVKLAQEIGKRAVTLGIVAPILLEIKLDSIEAKTGFSPEQVGDAAAEISSIQGIVVHGLMGLAPYGTEPEQARPPFRTLYSVYSRLPAAQRQVLSMGMTGDYEIAIEEGSTLVRIGTGLFGKRTPRNT